MTKEKAQKEYKGEYEGMSKMEMAMTIEDFKQELSQFTKEQYEDPDPLTQEEVDWLKERTKDQNSIGLWHMLVEQKDYRYRAFLEESGLEHTQANDNPYLLLFDCFNESASVELRGEYKEAFINDAIAKGCPLWRVEALIEYYCSQDVDELQEYIESDASITNVEVNEQVSVISVVEMDGKTYKLRIPAQYEIEDGRIYRHQREELVEICPHIIVPTEINKDTENGMEYVTLSFQRNGTWQSHTMPKTDAYNASKLKSLVNYGAVINAKEAQNLCDFLQKVEYENQSTLPLYTIASHLGWDEKCTAFVPYSDSCRYSKAGSFRQEFESIKRQEGTLDGWLAMMKMIRNDDHIQERIAMAASFASVLIKPASASPFMVDIWGGAGIGKTSILMAAASIWGDPRMPGGYIGTFNASEVANEQLAMFCCDLPVLLDEMQTIQNRKDFDDLVYKLCEGKPKGRATMSGGLREQGTWHNTILATGEQPIVSEDSMGGAQRRVINLQCDKPLFSGDKEEIARLRSNIAKNYGVAGRVFVSMLSVPENMERAKALVEEYRSQIAQVADGAQNLQGAIILAADTLATEWIFKDDVKLNVSDLIGCLKNDQAIDPNLRAHRKIMNWIADNQDMIIPLEKNGNTDDSTYYGRYQRSEDGRLFCAIPVDRFDELVKDERINRNAYIKWAKGQGKIYLDNDGKHSSRNITYTVRNGKELKRSYCLFIDEENMVSED